MKRERLLMSLIVFLISVAFFANLSRASENLHSNKVAASEKNSSSERVSNQSIPCNWEGWRNSFPGVRCTRRHCDRYIQVLSMKCMNGSLAEVKIDKVCGACVESPDI